MKAYGIPVQSYVFKPASASVTSANGGSLIGTFVKAESITSNSGTSATLRTVTAIHTTGNSNGGINSREADSTHTASSVVSTVNVKQEMPDLEGCHLTSKQLEEFMDEDCHGPVTSGDPMLSSPHLSPHDVLPSPASSGSHYSNNDDALTPDSMDLAVWQSASDQISSTPRYFFQYIFNSSRKDLIKNSDLIYSNHEMGSGTSSSTGSSPIYVSKASTPSLTASLMLPSSPVHPNAVTSSSSSGVVTTTSLRPHFFMLQPTSTGCGGSKASATVTTSRLTTLEHRRPPPRGANGNDSDKALIESALTNTEKIVANLLAANNQKQVVLKERTPNCFVVLWKN